MSEEISKMLNLDYKKMIKEQTGLSEEEIKKLMDEKRRALHGLVSEEGLLFLISKELGVELGKISMEDIEIFISDIKPQMKNITIIGRVKDVNPAFSFTKKDGTTGWIGSFILLDNTGEIKITLWDEQTEALKINKIGINSLVKIIKGYAREKSGKVEINLGKWSSLEIIPTTSETDLSKYPEVKQENVSVIDNLEELELMEEGMISVEGIVHSIEELKKVNLKSGEEVSLLGFRIREKNNKERSVRITLWREKAEYFSGILKKDCKVNLRNVLVKFNNYSNKNEISLTSKSFIAIN